MSIHQELAEAEARVEQLKLQIAQGTCAEVGHDWRQIGGRNAGCDEDCWCSIPVHVYAKCGDSDYGENEEAAVIMARCAEGGFTVFAAAVAEGDPPEWAGAECDLIDDADKPTSERREP